MHLFVIVAPNRPGSLAAILAAIAEHGVSVTTGGGATAGDVGAIALQFNDDDRARAALESVGATFHEVPTVAAWLEPDPGTLADAARRLGEAGVNIEALAPVELGGGRIGVLFGVDNLDLATIALGGDVVPLPD